MHTSSPIICIVPRLLPAIDGVGDYALNLALRLRKDYGIKTHFIVSDRASILSPQIEEFPVSQVKVHSASELLSLMPSDTATVLLHYVGYGYAKRGCPSWLVEGLERWKRRRNNTYLVTMFHEVYASGAIWNSSFWLSPLQRNLAARVARVSDRCLTSKQLYADIIHELSRGKQTEITTLPVFSNIGEPKQVPPLAERSRRLIVFGGRSQRLRVYQKSLAQLELACQLLGIEEIWDIGLSTNLNLPAVNGVPIVEMGQLPATEISNILLNSLAGFFNYHPEFLAKSTIFATYCAHGVLPASSRCSVPTDGIEAGKHYWVPDKETTDCKDWVEVQAIANNAYTWYQTHNLSVQANTFAAYLGKKIVEY
ncbi:glycosyltransferase family 1 protein [Cyanobacteria bacterium FACHB-472]|nr:glycosyltransferase family 1 protein [Cyanobacteria bacterium FACHB-472]